MTRSKARLALAAVVLLALGSRFVLLAPRLTQPLDDPDNYLPVARALSDGRGFEIHGRPSAYRPPLYPLSLVPIVRLPARLQPWGVAFWHLLLGAGTVVLTWRTARRWNLGEPRALAAAVLVALDPVLVVQSRSVMTETLAAFLLAGALHALGGTGWKSSARSGLWFGLAGLCRPSTLACACLGAFAALVASPGSVRQRLARSAALVVVTWLVLLPWAVRNAMVLGEPVWTTTHGGYTLALANNPEYYRDVLHGPPGAVWSGPSQRVWAERLYETSRGQNEPETDRIIRRRAEEFIRRHPGDFLLASAARLSRFWGLAPASRVYSWKLRLLSALWTFPFWIALALGLAWRASWRWPNLAAQAQIVGLTLVHTVFWTDLRMRAPVVPAMAILAAAAGLGWAPIRRDTQKQKNS